MSCIYFHGLHHESKVRGSERANMDIVCSDIAATVIRDDFGREPHRLLRLLPINTDPHTRLSLDYNHQLVASRGDAFGATQRVHEAAKMYLRSWLGDNKLRFNGQDYGVRNLVLNTVVATRSPVLSLMAKIHGYCESHVWVPEEHRVWLAGIIEDGQSTNILRDDMGWESAVEHLRNGDGGPVVLSDSVGDSFPYDSTWMDPAWPEEMVASGKYSYNDLSEDQQRAVDARGEAWDELPEDEKWRLGMTDIKRKWWLELTPDSLTTLSFAGPTSLWDAVASPEWRG